MSHEPVPVVSPPEPPPPQTLVCANCWAALAGEYCATCGQRHEPHVHTLGHFAGEAFESISHADSRLWRTLGYLLTRPGYLTHEFFAGRRARYLPPFRLYLVISLVFFLVASLTGETPVLRVQAEVSTATDRATTAQAAAPGGTVTKLDGVTDGIRDFCDQFRNQASSDNSTRNSLRDRCRKLAQDDGRELGASVVHNLPRTMFLFLPLIALFMKLLYWRPKRYYVEHLLFLVHNHACVFLAVTLVVLIAQLPYTESIVPWVGMGTGGYLVWYIFRAMRNTYGQGRALTLVKYFTLAFTYIVTSLVMLMLTFFYSAMTL